MLRMARFQDGENVTDDGRHVDKIRYLLKEANDTRAGINSDTFVTILIILQAPHPQICQTKPYMLPSQH